MRMKCTISKWGNEMNVYNVVMNSKFNPLSKLPRAVSFQIMVVLSWMWSVVFSVWVGSILAFGASVGIHMILLVGIFFTAEVFRRARKKEKAPTGTMSAAQTWPF